MSEMSWQVDESASKQQMSYAVWLYPVGQMFRSLLEMGVIAPSQYIPSLLAQSDRILTTLPPRGNVRSALEKYTDANCSPNFGH